MTVFKRLNRRKVLSVMPTYQCTASCSHCGTFSSPRENTWLGEDLILKSIKEAAELKYELVVFTGGEATLAKKQLLNGIRFATEHKWRQD